MQLYLVWGRKCGGHLYPGISHLNKAQTLTERVAKCHILELAHKQGVTVFSGENEGMHEWMDKWKPRASKAIRHFGKLGGVEKEGD